MKRLLLSLFTVAVVSGTALAQAPKDAKDVQKNKMEWEKKVKDDLKLNADQTEKYDALCKEYDGKYDALRQDASLSAEDKKQQMMTLKKEKEAKLFEFLTPEQQTQYKEMVDKKMKEMSSKKGY